MLSYNCDICGKNFKESSTLKSHVKHRHSPTSQECQFYGKHLSTKLTLENHIKRFHNESIQTLDKVI